MKLSIETGATLLAKISFTISEPEFIKAHQMIGKKRRWLPAATMINALLATGAIVELILSGTFFPWGVPALIFGGTTLRYFNWLYGSGPPSVRRQYRDDPSFGEATTVEWTPSGYSIKQQNATAAYAWSDMKRWTEDGAWLIVFRTPRRFFILPKRAIPIEAQQELRTYLEGTRRY
jgi:hypothetical protein